MSRITERGAPAPPSPPTRTAPLPPRPAPSVAPPVTPTSAPAPAPRFPDECRPASAAEILRAIGPGPRLRVVNHWATWCEPCVEEIPLLVAVHLNLEDRADFIGVCWECFDDDRPLVQVAEHVADFASIRAIRYPSLLVTDPAERFFEALKLGWKKIPQTWLVGRGGEILWRAEGALTEESAAELVQLVESLVPPKAT